MERTALSSGNVRPSGYCNEHLLGDLGVHSTGYVSPEKDLNAVYGENQTISGFVTRMCCPPPSLPPSARVVDAGSFQLAQAPSLERCEHGPAVRTSAHSSEMGTVPGGTFPCLHTRHPHCAPEQSLDLPLALTSRRFASRTVCLRDFGPLCSLCSSPPLSALENLPFTAG
eukprot:1731275-Rhodomonas_salina.1